MLSVFDIKADINLPSTHTTEIGRNIFKPHDLPQIWIHHYPRNIHNTETFLCVGFGWGFFET